MENLGIGINELIILLIIPLGVWTMVWKGIALWHAARNNQLGWFVALLVINTLGILEIVYLLAFRPKPPVAMGAPLTPG